MIDLVAIKAENCIHIRSRIKSMSEIITEEYKPFVQAVIKAYSDLEQDDMVGEVREDLKIALLQYIGDAALLGTCTK